MRWESAKDISGPVSFAHEICIFTRCTPTNMNNITVRIISDGIHMIDGDIDTMDDNVSLK